MHVYMWCMYHHWTTSKIILELEKVLLDPIFMILKCEFFTHLNGSCFLKLRMNGYTEWALVVPKEKAKMSPTSTNKFNTRPPSIGLPYVQGLSEIRSKTFRQHGVSVYHKPVHEHSTLHPRTPERQDAERQEVWCHNIIRDNMRSGPCTRVHR